MRVKMPKPLLKAIRHAAKNENANVETEIEKILNRYFKKSEYAKNALSSICKSKKNCDPVQ